jgi:hypothetical protein
MTPDGHTLPADDARRPDALPYLLLVLIAAPVVSLALVCMVIAIAGLGFSPDEVDMRSGGLFWVAVLTGGFGAAAVLERGIAPLMTHARHDRGHPFLGWLAFGVGLGVAAVAWTLLIGEPL